MAWCTYNFRLTRINNVSVTVPASKPAQDLADEIDKWIYLGNVNLQAAMWLDNKGHLCENVKRYTPLEAFDGHKNKFHGNNKLTACYNSERFYSEEECEEIDASFDDGVLDPDVLINTEKVAVYTFRLDTGQYAAISLMLLDKLRSAFAEGGRRGKRLTSWVNLDTWLAHGPGRGRGGAGVFIVYVCCVVLSGFLLLVVCVRCVDKSVAIRKTRSRLCETC